jgi:hypothetical protein
MPAVMPAFDARAAGTKSRLWTGAQAGGMTVLKILIGLVILVATVMLWPEEP